MVAIRLLRTILALSRRELARRSGVSVRELARIEAAEVLPRREAAKAIDRALLAAIMERAGRATERAE